MADFGALVRKYREARNMSQERLAELANLSPGYISLIETGNRGKKPSRNTVIGIAQALDADMLEFLRAAGRVTPDDELHPDPTRPSFESFVNTDPALRSNQKKLLIDLYRSWVRRTV